MVPKNPAQPDPAVEPDPEFEAALTRLKDWIGDEMFIGLLTRGFAALIFAFLFAICAYASFAKLPEFINDLLNKIFS